MNLRLRHQHVLLVVDKRETVIHKLAQQLGGPIVVGKGATDMVVGKAAWAEASNAGCNRRCGGLVWRTADTKFFGSCF